MRALLIDISGTLLVGSLPTPGAAQALAKLRAARIPFRLCSNTSKESTDAVHDRMRTAGLDVPREHVWTSIGALRALLQTLQIQKPFILLSPSALEECTFDNNNDGDDTSVPYDAVVVGLAPTLLDYAHLNTAFRILVGEHTSSRADHPRPPLIALHKARYIEAADHALALGPGPFVAALEDAAQTTATVVGKPTKAFFETVLRDLERELGGQSDGVAVIGDDVLADLGQGAVELGLKRVLVKTGKYRSGDEQRAEVPVDQVCDSFAEFVEVLLERRNTSS